MVAAVRMLEGNTTLSLPQAAWSNTIDLSTPSSSNSSYGSVGLTTPNANSSIISVGVSPWGTSLAVTSLVLCGMVGLPSNVAVIIAIVRRIVGKSTNSKEEKRDRFTLKLILTLAVCDMLSLLTIPGLIYVLLRGWSLGESACKFFTYLVYWTLYASVLTVTSMSVYYNKIIKIPNRKLLERLYVRRKRVWLVGLWVLAALLALPVIPSRSVVDRNRTLRCQRVVASKWQKVAGLLYEVLFGYAIPFCILLCSYCWLHNKVDKGVQTKETKKKQKKPRMNRLVVRLVVVFFVCWTPTQVIDIVDMVTTLTSDKDKYMQIKRVRDFVGDFAKALSFLNCCLNPFIYAFASKSVSIRCLHRARGEHGVH
ncbi:leukotriene B4 receptor 1-like [Engraulis encrasicolus]|uniref:leukotriene B4 receptor 1-like n=1 Tax=Engraulis encrasicolus TaxID=184585 RepID=UPI002FD0F9E4